MHAEEQVVSSDTTHVGTQGVTDASGAHDGHSRVPEEGQELGDAARHRAQVVNRCRVARDGRQFTPVHQEHIVTSVPEIC